MDNISHLVEKLNCQFNGRLGLSEDEQAICTVKEKLVKLLQTLKEYGGYNMLADITAVEYDDCFEIVYHIMKQENAGIIRIKVDMPKDAPSIPSVIQVWKAADVLEREIYDLIGISFEGHGNMKRILCPDDFEGHPLRKDFKLDIINRFQSNIY